MGVPMDQNLVNDVVIILEGTSNLGPYFEGLKNSYIKPILQYFSGGPPEEIDYGCDYSCTLFSLVTFYATDCLPGPMSSCEKPTGSTYELLQQIDRTQFVGGGGTSFLSEGLATALQLFDDLQKLRDPATVNSRHCILLCNSAPIQLPSQESIHYSNMTCDKLVSKMTEQGICFSVLSPRKIPQLFRLFDQNKGDTGQMMLKNYATDSRHLILLNNIPIEERPASPSVKKDDMDINKVNQGAGNRGMMRHPLPGGQQPTQGGLQQARNVANDILQQAIGQKSNDPQQPQQPQQQGVTAQQQPQQQQPQQQQPMSSQAISNLVISPPSLNMPTPVSSTVGAPQPQQLPTYMQQPRPQGGGLSHTSSNTLATATPSQHLHINQQPVQSTMNNPQMMTSAGNFTLSNTSNPQIISQNAPQMINSQQQGAGAGQSTSMPGLMTTQQVAGGQFSQGGAGVAGQTVGGPQGGDSSNFPSMELGNMRAKPDMTNQQKRPIWSGELEWLDKVVKTPPNANAIPTKVVRSLSCQVSVNQGDPDVDASKWPSKLSMQLIPQQVLSSLQSLFRQSRTVGFNFANNDIEALKNLYKVTSSGFAGCVNIPPTAHCDIRILMLLYSNRKKQFMGLIPKDQAGFLNGFKQVIESTRAKPGQQKQPGVPPFLMLERGVGGGGGGMAELNRMVPPPPSFHAHMMLAATAASTGGQGPGGVPSAAAGGPSGVVTSIAQTSTAPMNVTQNPVNVTQAGMGGGQMQQQPQPNANPNMTMQHQQQFQQMQAKNTIQQQRLIERQRQLQQQQHMQQQQQMQQQQMQHQQLQQQQQHLQQQQQQQQQLQQLQQQQRMQLQQQGGPGQQLAGAGQAPQQLRSLLIHAPQQVQQQQQIRQQMLLQQRQRAPNPTATPMPQPQQQQQQQAFDDFNLNDLLP